MTDYENFKEIAEAVDGIGNAVGDLIDLLRDDDVTTPLRDRLAMAALQGILAGRPTTLSETLPNEEVADVAYGIADAMLKAREKVE